MDLAEITRGPPPSAFPPCWDPTGRSRREARRWEGRAAGAPCGPKRSTKAGAQQAAQHLRSGSRRPETMHPCADRRAGARAAPAGNRRLVAAWSARSVVDVVFQRKDHLADAAEVLLRNVVMCHRVE